MRSRLWSWQSVAVLLLPILSYRMGLDQGVFAYIGAEIVDGRWPYVETWDHAFPGLMFLNAGEIILFGKSGALFRLFDWLYQMGCVWFIYSITRQVSDRTGGYFASALYVLVYQGYGPWNTAQREGFAMLFVLWGFWLYLTAKNRRPLFTTIGVGIGLGLAVTIKPTMLALASLYAPLLLRPSRKTVKLAIVGGAALLVPSLAIILTYWANGFIRDLYEACIAFQTQVYGHISRGSEPLLVSWMSNLSQLGLQTVLVATLYLPFLFWGRGLRARRMLYLGYLGSVFAVVVQGTFAGYHYLPGLALGAVLVGTMFSLTTSLVLGEARAAIGRFRVTTRLAVAHLLVLAALPVYLHRQPLENLVTLQFLERPEANEFRNRTVFDFTEDWDLAEHLRKNTESDDRIQVWGHESLVYYLAERDAASRFQTSNPLTARAPGEAITPMQVRWREEFMSDVTSLRPRYVAVVRSDDWWWAPEQQTSEQLLDDFPAWKRFIISEYSLEMTIGRFLVYRLR